MYNKKGLKFFIYNITKNKNKYMELPIELREIIWEYAHTHSIIECFICNKVLVNFCIAINNTNHNDNYLILNGLPKCNKCFID